jgi:DNA-binding transcriptional LysR family regulator
MPLLDLNLLSVFEALYDLRSATRAAQRLNLTQSAVSHALRRLRQAADDPLFLRSGGTLQPTARAEGMAPDIREGLARLRAAMVPVEFDPVRAVRTFTLAAGSYFCALLIPQLIARAREVAPGIGFRVLPVGSELLTQLDEGTVDLALGAFETVPQRVSVEILFREDLVWVAARDNPVAGRRLIVEDIMQTPHLVIATRRAFEPMGALLAEGSTVKDPPEHGTPAVGARDRAPVPATVYDALTAAAVVARTDMIALIPRRLAQIEQKRLGQRILQTDERGRGIDLAMATHDRASSDAGLAWLQRQIIEISQ